MTEQETTQNPDDTTPDKGCCKCSGGKISILAVGALVVGLASALIFSAVDPQGLTRFMFAYIISFAFFLSISLGALFFISIQHVTRAG
ncbi:MAG: hypothetical protein JKX85_11680, partial [Phycisphaeraceae bacterium]|nr:hypothetical protein [Phycisphaeraceae bacterium]